MRRATWWRATAAVSALALTLAACGDGDDDTAAEEPAEEETEEATPEETEPAEGDEVDINRPGRDDKLDLGYILPESGPLAFLGAPMITSVQLAVDDINAAGGALGQDVTLTTGDEAGDAAVVRDTAARLINGGVDGVVGAAASGMSQEIIQLLFDNQIVQCSPANTSPAFTDQENNGFYHRTVPPDQAVTPVIVDEVTADGHTNVAIAARADDYGVALADLVEAGLQDVGASVATRQDYDPNATDFSAEVSEIVGADPDAVVIIAFGEGAIMIRQLIEAGMSAEQFYGSDGLFGPTLAVGDAAVNPDDPGYIEGMKVIGAAGGAEFNDRLNEALPDDQKGNLIYGGQSYDCAIAIALAAVAADSADPVDFNDTFNEVVGGEGTECSSYEECVGLLEDGEQINYEGVSGPLENEGSDPTFGRYAIAQFQADGTLEVVGDQDINLAEIE